MHSGHNTRHSRAQLVFTCSWFSHAQRAQHTPLSRSVGSRDLACTAGTPHANRGLSWFLYAVGSRVHSEHTTRHSRAQLVLVITHAQRALNTPLTGSGRSHARGHTTRHSRAQLVFARTAGTPHANRGLSWFLHARRAQHTPPSGSGRSLVPTAGTTHVTLALSWFLHARRAHHTPLSRSVGSCMHSGHNTRHSRTLVDRMHSGLTTRQSRAQLIIACTAGTPHATLALSWFSHARRADRKSVV